MKTVHILICLGIICMLILFLLSKPAFPYELFTNTPVVKLTKVKTVSNPEETARGLMYRREPLGLLEAMVFDYGKVVKSDEKSFWMQNTFIPLGVLFLDSNRVVLDVIPLMQPHDLSSHKSKVPDWRYALEVSPELARNVSVGTLVDWPQ